ncbi:hypothetical protein C0Q70_11119 [Pomacea canaliculata]|uniref:Uncharacterized protein n=1 Tax=Pomacea canaliculata TaxID=400727 RepID=A0A2T7P542_POMCA|nr:hypothetical protein C0Q70_11119 [Pomacea canaliculata]
MASFEHVHRSARHSQCLSRHLSVQTSSQTSVVNDDVEVIHGTGLARRMTNFELAKKADLLLDLFELPFPPIFLLR